MSDQIRGGFDGALRSQMSSGLRRKLVEQEARERREAAAEERERAQRREDFQNRAFQAALQDAVSRGEDIDIAKAISTGRGLGNRSVSSSPGHPPKLTGWTP
jgi:hypothetical protein